MKKKISRILLIAFFIMFTLTTVGWAEEVELRLMEKSEVFEKWESLSEEEKEKVLVPQYYGIDIKQSVRRSRYNTLLGGSTSLESRFNLAEQYDLIVKDQKLTMSCWAFSTTTMLESNVAMRNVLLNEEYSPLHMEYRATEMYSKPKLGWGSADMALAYMVSGNGPVDESDFPMEDVYDEVNNSYTTHYLTDPDRVNVDLDKTVQLKITDTTTFANIVKKYDTTTGAVQYYDAYETQYTSEQVEAVRKKIKSHIKEYGAVTAGIYSDEDGVLTSTGNYISTYYDSNTDIYAYKVDYTSAESANHQITIVGWDDTKQAYIVQNSWGELFENNGYFYVAYDDVWIESRVYGINNIEELSGNNKYDQIYQYDELGMNYLMGLYVPAIYANVFTRENIPSGKDEYITEVGLYIAETTGIDIYVNAVDGEFTDSNGNTKLKLVHSGEILEPGYHVIKLNASEDTKLIGKQFIIAAKSTNDQGGAIPLEVNLYDTGSTLYSTEYDKATGNPGESFISANNLTNWTDLDGYLLNSIEKFKNSNVCIKAFTKYVEEQSEIPVTGVTVDKTTMIITEGETETLVATVSPDNATNPKVTWTSSNTSIATVSGEGVVTAKSEGTVTITVTTEDGGYTATCSVKVEPKVVSVTDVVLDEDELTIVEGETGKLVATVVPLNATNQNVTWKSSNTSIATVSTDGVVTAVAPGTANITVTTADGNYTATCEVNVTAETISVISVLMVPREKELRAGETATLTATVVPSNATNKNLRWESTDETIATVVGGIPHAKNVQRGQDQNRRSDQWDLTTPLLSREQELAHTRFNIKGLAFFSSQSGNTKIYPKPVISFVNI